MARSLLMVFLLVSSLIVTFPDTAPVRKPSDALSSFELDMPGWIRKGGGLTRAQDMLGYGMEALYDSVFLATMVSPRGTPIEVQIFYCSSRRPRNRLTSTSNKINCLHGHYAKARMETAALAGGIVVPRLRLGRMEKYSTLNYWLQSSGKTSDAGWKHLFWLYWQDLTLSRSDGCFVKAAYYGVTDPSRDRDLDELSSRLHEQLGRWLKQQAAP